MTEPTNPKEAASQFAKMWSEDWRPFFTEMQQLTGLTLEQAMLFDMVCSLRVVQRINREAAAMMRKQFEDEQRDDWEKP